jgi:alanyl-tRNA synthetase
MESTRVRALFLDFFRQRQHLIVPSAPIVNKEDPTLLFTNSGMNQFKDIFTGNKPATAPRVADTQKCLRVSGKHNDLEEVGFDTYHHTMFEMLGNWSFGDYFKKEAIEWSWKLLTEEYGIAKDRIYVTVFEGSAEDKLAFDQEAYDYWKQWIAEDRILRGNKKDNFWEMGDIGPCGPCSEIHVDTRPDAERQKVDGKTLVNRDHPQVIEIWNNVFMEFNRRWKHSGANAELAQYERAFAGTADEKKKARQKKHSELTVLDPLPAKHVDTGMGFERLCMVLQGKTSTYDTDVFSPIIRWLEQHSGKRYGGTMDITDVAIRVIADHIRAVGFAIADGQLPGNTGAGYVIRRILRRASRFGFQYLNFKEPFLYHLVPVLTGYFKDTFPELSKQEGFVAKIIESEEKSFLTKLEWGLNLLKSYMEGENDTIAQASETVYHPSAEAALKANPGQAFSFPINKELKAKKVIQGSLAFTLYDSYGFPLDLTELIAKEKGWTVEIEGPTGFDHWMDEQRNRSRAATSVQAGDWVDVQPGAPLPLFVGYDTLHLDAEIIRYRTVKTAKGNQYHIVLNRTPFYAESGGQVGDTGILHRHDQLIHVLDTQKENDLIVHVVDKLPTAPDGEWRAQVDEPRRRRIMANHSATHLLHAALRQVLGTHVEQRGSLVNEHILRFDFSHFQKMTDDELKRVEEICNEKIAAGVVKTELRDLPLAEAKALGAMALFGEKYGEHVRVIRFGADFSTELCGGTHVENTLQIRYFKITSESSISAGIRRMEAVTADGGLAYLEKQALSLDRIREILKQPQNVEKTVAELAEKNKELQARLDKLRGEQLTQLRDQLLGQTQAVGALKLLAKQVPTETADELKHLSFELRRQLKQTVIVLGAVMNDKPMLSVILSEDLQPAGGLDATKLVKDLAAEIQGGGGGQPFYATAGGKKTDGLQAALNKAPGAMQALAAVSK